MHAIWRLIKFLSASIYKRGTHGLGESRIAQTLTPTHAVSVRAGLRMGTFVPMFSCVLSDNVCLVMFVCKTIPFGNCRVELHS